LNVDCGDWISKENFSVDRIRQILIDQLVTPVRFPDQIRELYRRRLGRFIELSPVDVLTPFTEQILQTDGGTYKTESFRRLVKAPTQRKRDTSGLKNSKLLDIFNKALKSLSGYTVEDIHLEDRIREDLGIDSIKKAEIVFRMVDSMNNVDMGVSAPVNLAEFATFADVIEYLENSERAKEKMSTEALAKS
jgi:acyl carrier protein